METTFAKVNAFGDVLNVIVADQVFVDSLPDASSYVQTFADALGEASKRYNLAIVGGKFDAMNNAFIAPKPFNSWSLSAKFQWQAPMPFPKDGKPYDWDEATLSWKEVVLPAA